MVNFVSIPTLFKHSWENVTTAYWLRYPNQYSKHVLTEDTISREVVDGKLVTKRVITKTSPLPKWGEIIVRGPRFVYIIEESVVDPELRTTTTYTRNIGYQRLSSVIEKCVYSISRENDNWTSCHKLAWFDCGVVGFRRPINVFVTSQFKKRAARATKGLEMTLDRLYNPENITCESKASKTDKLRETARKATELAKSKARPILTTGQAT